MIDIVWVLYIVIYIKIRILTIFDIIVAAESRAANYRGRTGVPIAVLGIYKPVKNRIFAICFYIKEIIITLIAGILARNKV